jgi:hypothetical protein
MPTRLLVTALAVWGALAGRAARAQQAGSPEPQDQSTPWRFTLGAGVAVSDGRVPHLPPIPGLGARLLVEHGRWGAAATADLMAAYCVNGAEQDQGCGNLTLWGAGLSAALRPGRTWTPYATLLFQLAHGERYAFGLPYHYSSDETWVAGIGPRAGVRYRGRAFGFYLDTGPSFLRPSSDRNCEFGCSAWWFWQTSIGLTFSAG